MVPTDNDVVYSYSERLDQVEKTLRKIIEFLEDFGYP